MTSSWADATTRWAEATTRSLQATKLISDAALGGMVLLSASTAERLLPLPRKDIQVRLAEGGGAAACTRTASRMQSRMADGSLPLSD